MAAVKRFVRHKVVGQMWLKGLCLEVLACGHTAIPLPRPAISRVCRKCLRGISETDCDPRDYTQEGKPLIDVLWDEENDEELKRRGSR